MSLYLGSLQKAVTLAGTAEALSASELLVKRAVIKATAGNTGNIYVGGSGVDSSNGFVLDGGEELVLDGVSVDGSDQYWDLSNIYIDAGTNADSVSVVYSLEDGANPVAF